MPHTRDMTTTQNINRNFNPGTEVVVKWSTGYGDARILARNKGQDFTKVRVLITVTREIKLVNISDVEW